MAHAVMGFFASSYTPEEGSLTPYGEAYTGFIHYMKDHSPFRQFFTPDDLTIQAFQKTLDELDIVVVTQEHEDENILGGRMYLLGLTPLLEVEDDEDDSTTGTEG
jgi:hypothetical protein